jgi:HlyD family secretion protein
MGPEQTVKRDHAKGPAEPLKTSGTALVAQERPLPAKIPVRKPRRRSWVFLLLAFIIAGGAGGAYWWTHRVPPLPPGIASGNGRLEADEIDIQTKFADRILKLFVDEGDLVRGGQTLAIMDTRDLAAQLNAAEAQAALAEKAIDEAKSNVQQLETQLKLAQQEYDRTQDLVKRGFATHELFDQRTQQLSAAKAALLAGQAKELQAQHALDAANHNAELLKVNIEDNTLVAPRDGRIQYRLANVGEVLGAGGKVFTMLDIGYVYMDIYLPTPEAGKTKVGADARILLDAYPDRPIPAHVSFVATQNQFDPKAVEMKSERDKLMFRVRVRIDPKLLKAHEESVRSGLPGMGYVQLDPKTPWPESLQKNLVQ